MTNGNGYLRIVEKAWGEERWIRNDEKYCVKELHLNPGWQCSLHYHPEKTETFYVVKGRVQIERPTGTTTKAMQADMLHVGCWLHVPAGVPHRFQALEHRAILLECSTRHDDADVHRLEPSGKVG